MAEEIKPTEGQEQPSGEEATPEKVNVRETKEFLAVVGQLNEARAALQRIEDERKKRESEDAERKAKETGDFESLKQKIQAEKDAEISRMKLEVKRSKAEALTFGIQDEWAKQGVMNHIMGLDTDDAVNAFMDDLKKNSPNLFEVNSFPKSTTTPNGARVNNGSDGSDWASISKQLKSGTPQQVAAAINKVEQYMKENGGKMPPGM